MNPVALILDENLILPYSDIKVFRKSLRILSDERRFSKRDTQAMMQVRVKGMMARTSCMRES